MSRAQSNGPSRHEIPTFGTIALTDAAVPGTLCTDTAVLGPCVCNATYLAASGFGWIYHPWESRPLQDPSLVNISVLGATRFFSYQGAELNVAMVSAEGEKIARLGAPCVLV